MLIKDEDRYDKVIACNFRPVCRWKKTTKSKKMFLKKGSIIQCGDLLLKIERSNDFMRQMKPFCRDWLRIKRKS